MKDNPIDKYLIAYQSGLDTNEVEIPYKEVHNKRPNAKTLEQLGLENVTLDEFIVAQKVFQQAEQDDYPKQKGYERYVGTTPGSIKYVLIDKDPKTGKIQKTKGRANLNQ